MFSIVYVSGGIPGADALGTVYYREPGAFVDGFRGVATVFVFCSTFYAGVESVAVAATETKNPAQAIPLAIRQVIWRIVIIYMGSALFFGLTCPSDAPALVSGEGGAVSSPMTVAIQNAGFKGGSHLINAFIFATCLSAINSSIYIGSRTIFFMAQESKAPRFLGWADKRGVPIPAIIFTNLFGALSMMNVSTGASEAYNYIVNLSGVSTFLVWASISFTHIRFRRAWAAQGHTPEELPFRALFYPYGAYFGLVSTIFLAFVQGWTTLSPFKADKFVDAYILLPLFGVIYLGYKFVFKTKYLGLMEIDLQSGRRKDMDEGKKVAEEDVDSSTMPWWKRIYNSF